MPTITRTVSTRADAATVYAYLSDFTHAEEWDANTVSCRLQSGSGGVGSRYENVSRFRGRETTLVYELVEASPAERIVLRGENKTVRAVDTMTMAAADGGTRVTYQADFTFRGVAALLTPFLRKPLAQLGDEAERSLAAALGRL